MADGRTYIGKQAVDAGLADDIQSLEKLLTAMAANPARFGARRRVLAHRIPAAHI
jgi:ClpP class serine protease